MGEHIQLLVVVALEQKETLQCHNSKDTVAKSRSSIITNISLPEKRGEKVLIIVSFALLIADIALVVWHKVIGFKERGAKFLFISK